MLTIGCTSGSKPPNQSRMASRHPSTNTDHAGLPPLMSSLLHLAAFNGEVNRVKQRLAAGDDVDALCRECVNDEVSLLTPLYCAAANGHGKVVAVLLKAGANPSPVNAGVSPERGDLDVITMMIRAGAIADWTDHKNRTPLFGAAYGGHDKVVEVLLTAKATAVDIANCDGLTPLMISARNGHEKCVRLLVQAGANVLKRLSHDGFQALHCGALGGSVAVVRTLLDWGVDVNSVVKRAGDEMSDGMSALHVAAQAGNVNVIALLLDAGAAVDARAQEGKTALHHGAYFGHVHVVEALLYAGATVDAKNLHGTTALYSAALLGKDDVVKTLLRWGAGVDTVDVDGLTALFAAVNKGQPTTVKLLLDAGADPHLRDRDGATALLWAFSLPAVKVLLEAGVSVTPLDIYGNAVLHRMGMGGCGTAVICAVFKAGANPTLLNKAGLTAAQLAREKGHSDAAKLLDMLAAKYKHTVENALEAKDEPLTVVAELEVKMSSCVVGDTNDKVVVGLAEPKQDIEEERTQRVLQPCLNCQTLTHRRCARCRTAYICSRGCQVATLAEHRVECMEIYEERERAEAERDVAEKKEGSD